MVTIKSRAKLNLTLNIEGMFDNTYHRLSSVMTTVDVFDIVSVSKRSDNRVIVTVDNTIDVLNVANKVASAIVKEFGVNGVDIYVDKNVPIMGGMGGSSVDASAVISAMSMLYNLPLDKPMLDIASMLGSDIVYLLRGGLALVTGKGDEVTYINSDRQLDFVIINGPRLATTDVFREYDVQPDYTLHDNMLVLEHLTTGDIVNARFNMGNNLQSSAIRLAQNIADILSLCYQLHIPEPILTGSGGNLYILCNNGQEARKYCTLLTTHGVDCYTTCSTTSAIDIM
ncbi:MAG: hypothetical protein PHW00_00790 [Clostridia bacterium]|nr:hypothetical protein [Clostridia bacterium]